MNQELFDNMQKQMSPSPQVRAALSEKLAHPAKKRPVSWRKYGALAACAALVIGGISIYQLYQDKAKWTLVLWPLQRDAIVEPSALHSYYVTVEGSGEIIRQENSTTLTGGGDTGAPNTGDLPNGALAPSGALPGGAYIGDAPSQEEAVAAYEKLMDRFNGTYPDWYGGAYIDNSGYLVVQLVENKDPGDKTLELQVLDWTDSNHVMFGSCKYSLAHLKGLMNQLNAMPDQAPDWREVMASWGIDEEANRIDLTLTEVNDRILGLLAALANMDPDDDAIYVQVGQRAVADVGGEDVRTDSAMTEDPAVHHVMPGGTTAPDRDDLIAEEPVYDGPHYDILDLPEQGQPANTVDSVPEEDDGYTLGHDPDVGFLYPKQ